MNNAGGSGDNSRNNQVNRSYNSNSAPMMNNRNRQNNGPGQQKPQQNHQVLNCVLTTLISTIFENLFASLSN